MHLIWMVLYGNIIENYQMFKCLFNLYNTVHNVSGSFINVKVHGNIWCQYRSTNIAIHRNICGSSIFIQIFMDPTLIISLLFLLHLQLCTASNAIYGVWCSITPVWLDDTRQTRSSEQYTININTIKQDRRWNADKPSAALDPYIPNMIIHFVSQSKTC